MNVNRINSVIANHSEGNVNLGTKFHDHPFNSLIFPIQALMGPSAQTVVYSHNEEEEKVSE